jgi:hypothetical protein
VILLSHFPLQHAAHELRRFLREDEIDIELRGPREEEQLSLRAAFGSVAQEDAAASTRRSRQKLQAATKRKFRESLFSEPNRFSARGTPKRIIFVISVRFPGSVRRRRIDEIG